LWKKKQSNGDLYLIKIYKGKIICSLNGKNTINTLYVYENGMIKYKLNTGEWEIIGMKNIDEICLGTKDNIFTRLNTMEDLDMMAEYSSQ
jgi:hypothetical protein